MKIIKQLEAISGQKETSSSTDNVPKLILKNQQQQSQQNNQQIKIGSTKSNLSSKSIISSDMDLMNTMLNPTGVSGQNNNNNNNKNKKRKRADSLEHNKGKIID